MSTTVQQNIFRWNKQSLLDKTEHRASKKSKQWVSTIENALANTTINMPKPSRIWHVITKFEPTITEIEDNKSNISNRHGQAFPEPLKTEIDPKQHKPAKCSRQRIKNSKCW